MRVRFSVSFLIFLWAPMFTLWGLNTLSEQGGLGYSIPHNFWTYLATTSILLSFNIIKVAKFITKPR